MPGTARPRWERNFSETQIAVSTHPISRRHRPRVDRDVLALPSTWSSRSLRHGLFGLTDRGSRRRRDRRAPHYRRPWASPSAWPSCRRLGDKKGVTSRHGEATLLDGRGARPLRAARSWPAARSSSRLVLPLLKAEDRRLRRRARARVLRGLRARHAQANLTLGCSRARTCHHIVEICFKAFAKALYARDFPHRSAGRRRPACPPPKEPSGMRTIALVDLGTGNLHFGGARHLARAAADARPPPAPSIAPADAAAVLRADQIVVPARVPFATARPRSPAASATPSAAPSPPADPIRHRLGLSPLAESEEAPAPWASASSPARPTRLTPSEGVEDPPHGLEPGDAAAPGTGALTAIADDDAHFFVHSHSRRARRSALAASRHRSRPPRLVTAAVQRDNVTATHDLTPKEPGSGPPPARRVPLAAVG